jgi:hypothetical protein
MNSNLIVLIQLFVLETELIGSVLCAGCWTICVAFVVVRTK